jgi:TolB-like protein/tetratricopeptide (TPR) repeat protein
MSRSLFAELRRRNVIRAAILYIGAVWALAQGISQLGPSVGAPEWTTRWFLVAAAIGFPFWIAFAWFFEFTPEGLKLESEIDPKDSITAHTGKKLDRWIFAIMGLAIVLLLADRFVPRHSVGAVPEHSVAVMPFLDLSEAKDQEFLSDGISEDVLNLLARVPKLRVISRSSSFSFKRKDVPLPQIAQMLGVAYILEGSVRRAGKTLRISAQLVDARSDQNVWSGAFDRQMDDVFAIQDEIAGAVVGQLKLKLLGKARAIDPSAYEVYLQARQLARQGSRESIEHAIVLFKQVLAKAPGYAPAWGQLTSIYANQANDGSRPVQEALSLAREAANQALAADPDYAPVHSQLGWIEMTFTGDLSAAARHMERALALDSSSEAVVGNAAGLALTLGRLDLAIALNKAALVLDPLDGTVHINLGFIDLAAHRWDDAIASFRTGLHLSPGYVNARASLGIALLQKGDAAAALVEVQKEPEEAYRKIALAIVYYGLGRKVEADATLAELIGKYEKDGPYNIAAVLAYRNEADRAFEWLDKAHAHSDPGLAQIAIEPLFANLHNDPRWLPFLRKVGKDPETLAKIEFKVALPTERQAEASAEAAGNADATAH